MSIALFVFSAVVIILHLLFLKRGNRLPCSITKAFLIPSLLLLFWKLSSLVGIAFEQIQLLYAGMLLYTLGDILLEIKIHPVFFYAGALSFASGHLFNAAFFLSQGFNVLGFAVSALLWLSVFTLVLLFLKREGSKELLLIAIYIFFVLVMGLSVGASDIKLSGKLIAMLGALLFCFSDSLIAFSRAHNDTREYDMGIMITYISANALILLGILFS